jgi:low affinity Fe/Cu permease
MKNTVRHVLTRLGELTSHPTAFLIVGVYVLVWAVVDRESLDAHGIATIATWLMTLFIQRAEHRDTQAIHAKLDELLKTHGDARTELRELDQREPEEIEAHRQHELQTGEGAGQAVERP